MFNKKLWKRLFLFIPLTTLIFCFNSPRNEEEKKHTIMLSVRNTLQYLHYSPKPINDAYSENVYDKYFEMIDPGKKFFMASDMKDFSKHRHQLDDYFNGGDLIFFNLTINRLYERIDQIEGMTQDIIKKPINLNEDEVFYLDAKKKNYPANEKELYNEWKKYIKFNILQEIETLNSNEETQQKKKDSVIANHLKDTITVKKYTFEEKKSKALQEVKDNMTQFFKRIKKRKQMDLFSIYMNAYTEVFDPHTNYFSPKNKEDFDISFKGTFVGIGAVIQEKKGNLYFGELTIGAPAWKSKQITAGDRILKVRSTPSDEPVNVAGMLVDEAVRLIRGKLGTKVTITVEKKDKSIKEVTLVREEVSIEDTFARSIVVNTKDGKKIGFINLPSFNADFQNQKGRNASDDVKAEISKLKSQNVEGIVLDLRYNGGGSLTEVGDIMGLFMKGGPYVQVKGGEGKINTLKSKSREPIWTGPLVIMQNEMSASASEILAGQMQDYGRALVIGSPQSYGKGTVQTFIDLNRFLNTNDDFGAVKLTIQKFYRITGESTQRKGVQSDIAMKDFFSYSEIGERFDDYALAWDKIDSTPFERVGTNDWSVLEKKSEERMAQNKYYQLLLESAKWKEKLEKEETIPLNLDKFNALMNERKAQIEKFKPLDKFQNGLQFTIYPEEAKREKTDEVFKKKTENWIKNLQKDLFLEEAVHVISQMEK